LNIEAPYAYALGQDHLYCYSAARLLTEFYDASLKTSDSGWLPKISTAHLVYHRIQQTRRERPDIGEVLDFIERPRHAAAAQSVSALTLSDVVAGIAEQYPTQVAAIKELVSINAPEGLRIRQDAVSSVWLILEMLIENCLTHAHIKKDTLRVDVIGDTHDSRTPSSAGPRLTLYYEAKVARKSVDLLDKLTISPVWSDEDRTHHFGMFLLGAHARLLGGVTYIDAQSVANRQTRRVCILVVLPLAALVER
jgi:hypothetical protein